ncbi:hypothetical protein BS78_07G222400 [Paspalum vaginatum]|nr:hypothetical protein BS78_07G222400 [Paspalum vaginatum]
MASHLRPSSLPSSPRSNKTRVDQQLDKLKTIISSPLATIDTLCNGFRMLVSIYNSIEEMMCAPSNHESLCQTLQRKTVEGELGQSPVLLDLCNAMQESFIELKMIVQELLLGLKRGDDAAAHVKAYIQLTKKAHKQFKVCKTITSDEKDCRVVKVLAEARLITTLLLKSTSWFLSKQFQTPKRSIISKTFQKGKVVCEADQLQVLECSIRNLESGVELLYRRLILCRVSLLNTLSS